MAANFAKLAMLLSCALLLTAACRGAPEPKLEVGYYEETCPSAENVVRAAVSDAVRANAGVGPGLTRLLFLDCFVETHTKHMHAHARAPVHCVAELVVHTTHTKHMHAQGCDASVLLDPTLANPRPEKRGVPNFQSLRGFEVIDAAKDAVEEACPGTVSCADIVAFAARDASYFLSGYVVDFEMPAGRLDGRRSKAADTLPSLPPPSSNLTQLVDTFAAKGLGVEDIDPSFAKSLRRRCSPAADTNRNNNGDDEDDDPTVSQDAVTAAALDSQYYRNVLKRRVLLASDAALLSTPETARMVRDSARSVGGRWERKFGEAMVRMAGIDVKTGGHGEIRKDRRVVN